ncbi:NAD-dependent succinate-semialdehyde dehydrogenase [Streptomyces sp. NPDC001663]|uniref:NAD-dependent succinate-semialdehyde dehydrogenase n=1 Tax=Streptomyces sp. NPDC001663 TaxID=3364597 RepID=UPI0036AE2F12
MTLATDLFIDGRWVPSSSGRRFDVEDPATRKVVATVADAEVEDGRAAAEAAHRAADGWRGTAPRDRAELLRAMYDEMVAAADEIAGLIVTENGKPLADARAEVAYAAEFYRWYSEEAVRLPGYLTTSPSGARRIMEISQPVGVSLLLTPWNLPAAMITRKIAPALAAGCTVVVKPSFQTPLTALYLARIAEKVGVPPGVINIVPTTRNVDVVGDLIAEGPVRALSFTGSTQVGSKLLAQASGRVLKCSMELGGNAPFIVFDDADLDAAVAGAVVAKMRHNAEACTAANRFLVQASVHDEFVTRLSAELGAMRLGPGDQDGVQVGPLASRSAVDSVREAVAAAVKAGARAVTCGTEPDDEGYYLAPTLLLDVPRDAEVLQYEMFAPVAPVVAFDTEEEAIKLANATDMGLASYVYSGDLARALRVAERVDAGMVGVNTGILSDPAAPFGGTKHSGIGREGGRHGITEFLETKYIAVDW